MGIKNIQGNLNIDGKLTVSQPPVEANDVVRKKELTEALVGKTDYLGTVAAIAELSTSAGRGDFYRVSTAFTFSDDTAHVGDILIAVKDNPAQNNTDWDLVHTELNSATIVTVDGAAQVSWEANTKLDKVTPTAGIEMYYATKEGQRSFNLGTDGILGFSGNSPVSLQYGPGVTANTIVQRNNNGDIIVGSNPSNVLAAVNKNYVDDLIAGLLSRTEVLEAKLADVTPEEISTIFNEEA